MTAETEKLQKVMARCGLGSRRAMELWIDEGRVRINGRLAKLGDRVGARDSVMVDGAPLPATHYQQSTQCLIYHKPEGEVCTRADTQDRPTVFDNLPELPVGRWVSVGRLDLNTSGLLLFTNNGDLANRLMHPSTGIVRRYLVRVRGQLSARTIDLITGKGVMLDGKLASFDAVRLPEMPSEKSANHWVEVSIKEGRYREVRRIFEQVGHTVSRLKRIAYGTVKLSRQLRLGRSEKMAPMQLERLLMAYGLDAFLQDSRGADRSDDDVDGVGQKHVKKHRAAKPKPNMRKNDSKTESDSLYGRKKRKTTRRAMTRPQRGEGEGRHIAETERGGRKAERAKSPNSPSSRKKRSTVRRKKTSTRRTKR